MDFFPQIAHALAISRIPLLSMPIGRAGRSPWSNAQKAIALAPPWRMAWNRANYTISDVM